MAGPDSGADNGSVYVVTHENFLETAYRVIDELLSGSGPARPAGRPHTPIPRMGRDREMEDMVGRVLDRYAEELERQNRPI